MVKSELRISVIIPNWNHRQLLVECIVSIGDTAATLSHEIIVVDNASSDDSAAYVKKNFPAVIWIQNDTNLGYAKAVNQGAKRARGDFLFLLNNDVKLLEGTTEKLVNFLAANSSAGAAAPLLFYPDGRMQISCRRFPTPSALLLESLGIDALGPFRRWKLTGEEHLAAGVIRQPMASALMVKRECWDEVGLLDEGMPLYFNDVEWCYRLYKNTPWRIYLVPEAHVVHHEGASASLLGYRRKIAFYQGLIRFYCKHFPFSNRLPFWSFLSFW
ncbi:MAG: glycosyltransferase family 2 protein [Nitrospirae bacterium]|nr:glycosyltransferase family 2 protein [Nitrospirota bacterium]